MIVTLNNYEMLFCRDLACKRMLSNLSAGVTERKVGDGDPYEIGLDGVISEYAFCKARNIFFDCSVEPRSGGYDCVSKDGVRIDIKSVRQKNRGLTIPLKIKENVDIFVLAHITGNIVNYYAYCRAEDIYKPENIKNIGYGDSYCLPLNALKQM